MKKHVETLDRLSRSGNLYPYHQALAELLEAQLSELERFKKDITNLKSQVTKLTNRIKELERE
ncbi:hypothetical protein QF117_09215 [Vibrio sp. YMD68]|uniref:hypothetical protein n=1 Tax=Vibrio sp. YMD68 TaxID=3042300 RepID=UPI00249C0B92|nr:hypothetical protein [Vibrio sp. YMD68]WGW00338.1 hypothetical protein QF117_21160 [Vibrio sp. YMD68]WGW00981.1 hypothetical protein QF117_09215 [Vibrio sp. YMD68]